MRISIRSGYSPELTEPDKICEKASKLLKDVKFDTIVGAGTSGLLILPLLARHLGVTYVAVRKPNDGSHAGELCEGELGERWVFVDDFVSSGKTLARCYFAIESVAGQRHHDTEFAGAFQYQMAGSFTTPASSTWLQSSLDSWTTHPTIFGEVARR